MDQTLLLSIVILVIYIGVSVLDRLYLQRAPVDIKLILKNAMLVYSSVLAGLYGTEFLKKYTTTVSSVENPPVFTDPLPTPF
jgi:hypothetical protein